MGKKRIILLVILAILIIAFVISYFLFFKKPASYSPLENLEQTLTSQPEAGFTNITSPISLSDTQNIQTQLSSDTLQSQLAALANLTLPQPILNNPINNATLNPGNIPFQFDLPNLSEYNLTSYNFSYVAYLANQSDIPLDPQNIIYNGTSTNFSYNISQPGQYFWDVVVNASGLLNISNISISQPFVITTPNITTNLTNTNNTANLNNTNITTNLTNTNNTANLNNTNITANLTGNETAETFEQEEEQEQVCTEGEEKCEGEYSYLCISNLWASKGKIAGKCGYQPEPEQEEQAQQQGTKSTSTKWIVLSLVVLLVFIIIVVLFFIFHKKEESSSMQGTQQPPFPPTPYTPPIQQQSQQPYQTQY